MTMKAWIRSPFSLALVAMLGVLGACTKKAGVDATTIRMRLPTDPPSLDWTLATDNVSKEVLQNIQDGLIEHDVDMKVRPSLAASWTISPDGKTYTFKLRKGVKWTDGQELVAQHFVDSWERLLAPATASEYSYFLFDVVNAEGYQKGEIKDFGQVGIKATDAETLVVTLKVPAAYWIHIPGFWVTYPIRKDVIAQHGDKWTQPANMQTLGAYRLKAWEHDSKLVLEKNPTYFEAEAIAGAPQNVEFRVVKEESTAVTLFEGGQLDIVRDLPPSQVPTLANMPEFISTPYLRSYYVGFHVKNGQVADRRVREALALAIDRNEVAKVLPKMVTPESSWVPPGMIAYNSERGIKHDPVKAKAIWDSIAKKPATIDYWFDTRERNKLVAENLQNQWKRTLGVDVKIQNQEWKVYLKFLEKSPPAVFRMGWGADYPDPDNFLNLFPCQSGNNHTGFCNATYDGLLKTASGSQNEAERIKAYDQAQKILLEDEIAIVPLFVEANLHLVARRVEGFRPNNMGDFYFRNLRLK